MAPADSRSNASADSYIGSLISLTSKSEIRYEGFLRNIDTEESSIGLVNVRSYGTEGRKKDGQQVPPSDTVYEYILFRGSDIKDLQVKASPPVQAVLHDLDDPAIIKSEYARPSSMLTRMSSAGDRPVAPSSYTPQLEAPKSTFQGGVPLYRPGGSFGSWGSSPPNTDCNDNVMQSQHSHSPYVSTSLPSASSCNVEGSSFHTAQITVPRSTSQDCLPVYQPGGSFGSWGYSSLPNAEGSGPAAAMYWQGFNGTSSGISQAPQLSSYQPSHGSSMLDTMHQPSFHCTGASKLTVSSNLPASNISTPSSPVSKMSDPGLLPLKISAPNLPVPNVSVPNQPTPNLSAPILPTPNQSVQNMPPSNSQELLPPLLPRFNVGSLNSASNTVHCTLFPQSTASSSELTSNVTSNMVSSVYPASTSCSHFPLVQPTLVGLNKNGITVTGSVPSTAPILPLPHQTIPPYVPPVSRTSKSSHSERSKPLLVTPDQLMQRRPVLLSPPLLSNPAKKNVEIVRTEESKSHPAKKNVEVVRAVSSKPPLLPIAVTQPPLLPLPSSANRKISRPVTRFTKEFDFMAMNEKFKKDEVWGELGKTNKMANNEEDRKENHRDASEGDNVVGSLQEEKPVYVKDDFFDSLSCNSLDNRQRNGCRPKFSEQKKIDTETFGNFRRNQGGHGGRWPARGGRGSSRGGRSQGYGRGQRYY